MDIIDQFGNIKTFLPTDTVNDVEEFVEPVDERYKLEIYPTGFDPKMDKGVYLIFKDKETWDAYKRKEWYFCEQEYNAFLISPHANREFQRDEFYAKRVTFAKQSNFAAMKGNKKEWVYTPNEEKKVLA